MTDAQVKARQRAEQSGIKALQITHRSPVKDLRAHVIALHGVIERTNQRIENIRRKAEEEEVNFIETNQSLIEEIRALLEEVATLREKEKQLQARLQGSKLNLQDASSSLSYLHHRSSIQSMNELSGDGFTPPDNQVSIALSDIAGCSRMFEVFGEEKTRELIIQHNAVLLEELHKLEGYEVKNESDVFLVVFQKPFEAVKWCLSVQSRLMRTQWPDWVQEYPLTSIVHRMEEVVEPAKFEKKPEDTAQQRRAARRRARTVGPANEEEKEKEKGKEEGKEEGEDEGPKEDKPQFVQREMLWNGPRVRMGVFTGTPTRQQDPVTGRFMYSGAVLDKARAVQAVGHGGQILIDDLTQREVRSKSSRLGNPAFINLGNVSIHGHKHAEVLYSLLPDALKNRDLPPPHDPPRLPSTVRSHEDFQALHKEAGIDHTRSIKLLGDNKDLMNRTESLQRRMEFLLSEYTTNMTLLKSQTKAQQAKFDEGERVLMAKQKVISALNDALKSRLAQLQQRFATLGPPFDRIPILEQSILDLIAEKRKVRQQRQEERNGYAQEMSVILHHLSRFREEYLNTVNITNEILEWKGQKLLKVPKGWKNPALRQHYGEWNDDPEVRKQMFAVKGIMGEELPVASTTTTATSPKKGNVASDSQEPSSS
eukprot:TRINITY_DN5082_c0_g1_i1.p1 TRINITY_DN5082_c0_g1~~TRINITY_DN5082_c0_g1_i1.p1  ORF type:complete len:652 (-),score=125.63 TRINITY_DN5082_c0_g1_i1:42-1997(-)